MTITRHKAFFGGHPSCNCGYDPQIILGEDLDWGEAANALLVHIKKSRRWKYLGLEFHYGLGYYIWENELTQKRWALIEGDYLQLTGVSRHPRIQVRWTA